MLKGRKLITPTYYSTHNHPFELFNFDRSSYLEKKCTNIVKFQLLLNKLLLIKQDTTKDVIFCTIFSIGARVKKKVKRIII
jgi:hypothetical protein